jgi:hypothetical protein
MDALTLNFIKPIQTCLFNRFIPVCMTGTLLDFTLNQESLKMNNPANKKDRNRSKKGEINPVQEWGG